MKKIIYKILLIVAIATSLTGCAVTGIFGHSSSQIEKQNNRITSVETKISNVQENKIAEVQQLAYGVDFSLSKATNQEPAVKVAQELNSRVENIFGLPVLEQQKAMVEMVSNLISNNVAGQNELAAKDKELIAIQNEESILVAAKNKEVTKALEMSKQVALANDTKQAELSKYTAYWGLGAVLMGIKSFATHSFWALLIGVIIFIVLRVLSLTNPLAAAVFGIFQSLGASLIHLVESIIPDSISTLEAAKADVKTVADTIATATQPKT